MYAQLEHANVDVPTIDATVQFLQTAFPHFTVRGRGISPTFGPWVHVGDDTYYIALQQSGTAPPLGVHTALRHLAWVVDDISELTNRLFAAGFKPTDEDDLNSHPYRKRIYFCDDNGIEWEFIQYLSELTSQRNDYQL